MGLLGCVFGLGVLGCIDFSGSRLSKDGYHWNQRNKDGRNVLNLVNQKGAAQSIRDKFKELQSRCFIDFHVPEGQTSGIAHHRSGGFSSAHQRKKGAEPNGARKESGRGGLWRVGLGWLSGAQRLNQVIVLQVTVFFVAGGWGVCGVCIANHSYLYKL